MKGSGIELRYGYSGEKFNNIFHAKILMRQCLKQYIIITVYTYSLTVCTLYRYGDTVQRICTVRTFLPFWF